MFLQSIHVIICNEIHLTSLAAPGAFLAGYGQLLRKVGWCHLVA